MKKLISTLFLFIGLLAFAQTGIKFDEGNFSSLLAKAKKENKLIFLDAYASWCGPCKLMAKNIFTLQSVGDYYNSHFVNAKMDMEKGEGVELAKKYNVKAYPTYLFINGDGEVVHRVLGYVEEKPFIQFAKDAEDPKRNIGALKARFEKGDADPEFLRNLAMLTIYEDADFSGKVTKKYFEVKSDKAFSQEDAQLLLSGLMNTEDPRYEIFKNKKEEIVKILPAAQYEAFDKNIKMNTIVKKAYNPDTKTLNTEYFLTETEKAFGKEQAEKMLVRVKASYALKNKDYAAYEKLTLEQYKDFSKANANELNSAAWNFFENVKDKKSLQTAILWAQESVKKDESYANTDTLANLYNKVGDKKNAKLWAEKSVELAKKSGEDATETQKLLDSLKK
ncbi:thioredoxin family protein [Elizabethkingia anophelis]|uniref:Thiol:disulfide interchange protein n=1 Tax=Elizabethkingia anophelis TaxID=1117645 RepID=A0A494J7E7_9FLAO|nr:thioredoxin fold domain-containing protein [Elizabethkingia anophelis]AQX50815.1 thiol:disulfide interchange protein [Elizabethkingia anophelis]ELB0067945.1 thioredoxin fold domain-containing protein [Elizabethkingia anophelis]ELB1892640.1 thioredoxin fold domain-containing protein [Elizabethkingia anophelis]MCT3641856.1 thioredoxin fold domain-containing protein [Elizabethkingia anophelis]MCT4197258.1 thioredoxin fold domain-containing protein [Elizabethkingia anophelis]